MTALMTKPALEAVGREMKGEFHKWWVWLHGIVNVCYYSDIIMMMNSVELSSSNSQTPDSDLKLELQGVESKHASFLASRKNAVVTCYFCTPSSCAC